MPVHFADGIWPTLFLRRPILLLNERERRGGQENEGGAIRAVASRVRIRDRHDQGGCPEVWCPPAACASGGEPCAASRSHIPSAIQTGAGSGRRVHRRHSGGGPARSAQAAAY